MSDSEELSSAADIPADAEIESCLRNVVREATKKDEEVTFKLARTRAEEKLGLEAGFLKNNEQWKQRSKDLIAAAFEEPPSPEKAKKPARAAPAKPAPEAGTKRKSDETLPSRKKQKKSAVKDSDADDSELEVSEQSGVAAAQKPDTRRSKQEPECDAKSELSDPPQDEEKPSLNQYNGKAAEEDEESELSSVIDEPAPKKKRQKKAAAKPETKPKPAKPQKPSKPKTPAEDDESDLSELLDDSPPKKARKKKSTSPSATAKPKPTKTLTPDEEQIKSLQSWLLKCGIRKLWHRELAPFDTNKEKIRHLKGMLDEAGMTGRYSAEKAKQIKEARELKAELEAATEFNKTWGHDDEEDGSGEEDGEKGGEEEEKPAPGKRARPKGFVDFGDSDEESE